MEAQFQGGRKVKRNNSDVYPIHRFKALVQAAGAIGAGTGAGIPAAAKSTSVLLTSPLVCLLGQSREI